MEQTPKAEAQLRRVNAPRKFAEYEGGLWLIWPWPGSKLDGRVLKKRGKTIDIDGLRVHAIEMMDGRVWDSINGWRGQQDDDGPTPDPIKSQDAPLENPAQDYALRIWSGQSPDLPRAERIARVAAGLAGQNMSMDGVTLPVTHDSKPEQK